MIDYQRIESGGQLVAYRRLSDGAQIPIANDNGDYQALQAQIAGGYTPLTADPPLIVYGRTITVDQRLRTTNATPAEIWRATLAQVTLYRASLELLGVDAGNGNARYIDAKIIAKRLANGALMVGAPAVEANIQDAGASTWAITAAVSGNDFVITVTGQAGRSIDWQLSGRVVSFTPAGES